MTIPTTDKTTLPLLKLLKDGNVHSVKESAKILAEDFGLTDDEKSELRRDGIKETKILDKVRWSRTNLKKSKLIEDVLDTQDQIKITPQGSELLNENPPDLTAKYLANRFPELWKKSSENKVWKLSELTTFIEGEMKMQYNFQPVMILSLLKCPNFTATKSLIREQFKRYNQFADKNYAEPLREAIIATTETQDRNIISDIGNDQIRLNLEDLDQDSKNKLVELCYEQIAKWDSYWILDNSGTREKIPDSSQIYLLEVDEKGSKEILENKYLYENWADFEKNKRDRVYGEVKPGDLLLVYFTNRSLIHQKITKLVYSVLSVSDDHVKLELRPVKQLFGVHLDTVRKNRDNGNLSKKYNLIGQTGNITKISRQDYVDMITLDYKSKLNVDDVIFSTSKSVVETVMQQHKKGPFSNLPEFLKDKRVEGYKGEILEKAKNIFDSQDNIVETLKAVCGSKVVGNHIFRLNGGEAESEARVLYAISKENETIQNEFAQKLSTFFKSQTEIECGNKWESLVSLMKSIKSNDTRPDFLFLSYLAFLQNPKLHFLFTPTKTDELFKFFNISEEISYNKDGKNWNNYSILLELANELRLKLAGNLDLDLIDVQGYMWVLGSALQKGIKPDVGVEDVSDSIDTTEFEDILEHKSQMILYGPPGTGKTYTAKKIAESFTGKSFDDTQSPSCFLALGGWTNWNHTFENEPLRWGVDPSTPSNLGVYNSVKEGDYIFFYQNQDEPRKFKKRGLFGMAKVIRKYSSEEPYWPDEISAGNTIYTERFEMELLKRAQDDSEIIPWIDGLPFTKGLNSIKNEESLNKLLTSVDKHWNIKLNCTFIKRITFHQSFSYEEFIEGIKAEAHGEHVSFNVSPGIFKEFCNCARRNIDQKFVMIIDEINRGNISKILGELITLLEKDKRGDTTTLPYSKELFSIPENIYIIGTMNTADRSLVLLDAALRRRFAFYEIMPDSSLLENKDVGNVDLTILLESINKKIKEKDMRDYQIGHSYFMKGDAPIETEAELLFAMVYEIIPLVKEYFYNEQKKIDDVLGKELGSSDTNQNWRKDPQELIISLIRAFPDSKVKDLPDDEV